MSNDNATRSGTSKLTGAKTVLFVASGAPEVLRRVNTPSHAPGPAGRFEAFDVLDVNGVPHAIAIDVGTTPTVG